MKDSSKILKKKIEDLEDQLLALQEAHKQLSEHYHEFVKATVEYLKENAEEE
jgi:prefoldin subunit 5